MNILTQLWGAFSLKKQDAESGNSPRSLNQFTRMKEGTVKFFNNSKGFGFIQGPEGNDIFVHVSGLVDEIRDNDRVTYQVEEGKKGLNAVNVRLL
jgi:CspA family cold shock protein